MISNIIHPGRVRIPFFVSAGAGANRGATGAITPGWPTGLVANDFLLLQMTIHSTTGDSGSQSGGGWTTIGSYQIGSTDVGQHSLYWKLATGSESGTTSLNYSTDGGVCKIARIYAFRNVHTVNPYSFVGNANLNQTNLNDVDLTSTLAFQLGLNIYAINDDHAINAMTGGGNGSWTELDAEYTTTSGNDGCVGIQACLLRNIGNQVGGHSFTMPESDHWSNVGLLLNPAA